MSLGSKFFGVVFLFFFLMRNIECQTTPFPVSVGKIVLSPTFSSGGLTPLCAKIGSMATLLGNIKPTSVNWPTAGYTIGTLPTGFTSLFTAHLCSNCAGIPRPIFVSGSSLIYYCYASNIAQLGASIDLSPAHFISGSLAAITPTISALNSWSASSVGVYGQGNVYLLKGLVSKLKSAGITVPTKIATLPSSVALNLQTDLSFNHVFYYTGVPNVLKIKTDKSIELQNISDSAYYNGLTAYVNLAGITFTLDGSETYLDFISKVYTKTLSALNLDGDFARASDENLAYALAVLNAARAVTIALPAAELAVVNDKVKALTAEQALRLNVIAPTTDQQLGDALTVLNSVSTSTRIAAQISAIKVEQALRLNVVVPTTDQQLADALIVLNSVPTSTRIAAQISAIKVEQALRLNVAAPTTDQQLGDALTVLNSVPTSTRIAAQISAINTEIINRFQAAEAKAITIPDLTTLLSNPNYSAKAATTLQGKGLVGTKVSLWLKAYGFVH